MADHELVRLCNGNNGW